MIKRPLLSVGFVRKHGYGFGLAAALTAIGLAALFLAGSKLEKSKIYTNAGVSAPTPK